MTFKLQPTLENELIMIRPLEAADYNDLYTVASDSLIWEQHGTERHQREEYAAWFKESMQSGGTVVVIDKATGKIIGSSRYRMVDGTESAVEIGWTFLARKYWGGQYNRAVKELMLDHAFETLTDVIFYVDPHNIRSQKALEKIGVKRISSDKFPHFIQNGNVTYWIGKETWEMNMADAR